MGAVAEWMRSCATSWRGPYAVQTYVAMGAWVIARVVVVLGVDEVRSDWRETFSLLPLLPAVWAMFALARYIGRLDELERRKYLEAFVFAFAATFLVMSVIAQLELARGSAVGVDGLLTTLFVSLSLGYGVASWRYR